MPGFFDNLPLELAREAETLSALVHGLREDRKSVLARQGAEDEAALLAKIEAGQADEHPAYDDYLSACALQAAYDAAREALRLTLQGQEAWLKLPLMELKMAADAALATQLAKESTLCRDALQIFFKNGVEVELRLAADQEYVFAGRYGDAMWRIDTAPVGEGRSLGASHLHDADGRRRADPVTRPDRSPLDNLLALATALAADPLLESGPGTA